ncbi:hypothetical protein P4H37_29125, partial [Paenibacillus thiaminolyticus]
DNLLLCLIMVSTPYLNDIARQRGLFSLSHANPDGTASLRFTLCKVKPVVTGLGIEGFTFFT